MLLHTNTDRHVYNRRHTPSTRNMSGGAASGPRLKQSAQRHIVPLASIAKKARMDKSLAASTAGRAAVRAIARWNGVTDDDEVDTLKAQIAELDDESDEDSAAEYAIIQSRFEALAAEYNVKATEQANAELKFACAICFENRDMHDLRIVAPCGHGFCRECIETHMGVAAAAQADPVCPNCRGPMTSVLTARF